jgi:hypothetical protein
MDTVMRIAWTIVEVFGWRNGMRIGESEDETALIPSVVIS